MLTMTEPETSPHKRFFQVLVEHSDSREDPISEWKLVGYVLNGGATHCICDTQITLNYKIIHKRTQKELIIGSECVKRWLNPKLVCEQCQTPLGCVMERFKNADFFCRRCKVQKQKDALAVLEAQRNVAVQITQEELKKEAKKQRMGEWILFWYGKYYQKPFKVAVQDEDYVNTLLEIPEDKHTKSLQYFLEYASLIHTIQEIEVEVGV